MKIQHLLEKRVAIDSDRIAYRFLPNDRDEITVTYRDLYKSASQICSALKTTSLIGQRIVLLFPSGLDFVSAFFGCLLAEAIPVPLAMPRPRDPSNRLTMALENCDPALILTAKDTFDRVHLSLPAEFKQRLASMSDECIVDRTKASVVVAKSDVAFLQYTSGSTSAPKGVVLSHANVIANLQQIERMFGHTRDSSGVIWLPHFHDMGLIGGILQPLFTGFPVTLLSPESFMQRPLRWLQAISKYRGTTSGAPNFAYDLCIEKANKNPIVDLDLSCWKVAFNGAEPVRQKTMSAFSLMFSEYGFSKKSFLPCYGLAEATLLVSAAKASEFSVKTPAAVTRTEDLGPAESCSCGFPGENIAVTILCPDDDSECNPGEIGEVCIAGPNVSSGYWGIVPARPSKILRTGDLGYLSNGELFITSRLKDLIVIRGKNVFPEDVEETVKDADPLFVIESAAAFGVPSSEGESLIFLQEVSARTIRTVDISRVAEIAKLLVLERHGVKVQEFIHVQSGSLIRTSSGKISRSGCRKLFLTQNLRLVTSKSTNISFDNQN
jgi:acyl-CoA synthetase (AMP-forming)/AMP-acid ligase II